MTCMLNIFLLVYSSSVSCSRRPRPEPRQDDRDRRRVGGGEERLGAWRTPRDDPPPRTEERSQKPPEGTEETDEAGWTTVKR